MLYIHRLSAASGALDRNVRVRSTSTSFFWYMSLDAY